MGARNGVHNDFKPLFKSQLNIKKTFVSLIPNYAYFSNSLGLIHLKKNWVLETSLLYFSIVLLYNKAYSKQNNTEV